MRLTILYRDHSEHSRGVLEFVEMLRRRFPGAKPEMVDIDTRAGAAEASLRGISRYPAFIVTTYEGRALQQWEGEPLPLIDEVGGMLMQGEPLDLAVK